MSRALARWAALGLGLGCGAKDDPGAGGGDGGAGGGADGAADGGDGGLDSGAPPDAAAVELAGVCPQELRFGVFTVDSNEDYAAVAGAAADGVVPTAVLTELLRSGDCTIWRRENPFCDPPCASGETCGLDGACVPYPAAVELGTVDVFGLLQPVSMSPVNPGAAYFDTSVPNPPWTAGAVLTLRTGGGPSAPVRVNAVAPEALAMEGADWSLSPGADFTVRWTAAAPGARTEVLLQLRIDQHGLTPASLECVFADDGEGTVPADTLDTLIGFGLTGFPAGSLARRTVDHAELGAGCIELHASSSRLARVEIEGYTPCRRDDECPEGQTCNEALERCE